MSYFDRHDSLGLDVTSAHVNFSLLLMVDPLMKVDHVNREQTMACRGFYHELNDCVVNHYVMNDHVIEHLKDVVRVDCDREPKVHVAKNDAVMKNAGPKDAVVFALVDVLVARGVRDIAEVRVAEIRAVAVRRVVDERNVVVRLEFYREQKGHAMDAPSVVSVRED
ncbi:MAG: hypothetical protein COA78_13680 [Blastopirellula sp.]|nr:MAG: hypothetical protein COA78_13680 [Blastopirellula sp.]